MNIVLQNSFIHTARFSGGHFRALRFSLFLLTCLTSQLFAADFQVDARFQPEVIRQGETSIYRLNVVIEGAGSFNLQNESLPEIPEVAGLRMQYVGPSQEYTIINRRSTFRLSLLYRVEASQAGIYEVPAFSFPFAGRTLEAPSAELEVIERGATTLPDREREEPVRSKPWLEVELPRERLYSGEAVPATVRLYVSNEAIIDARLGAYHPEKIGDSFAVGEFSQMRQRREFIDGVSHSVAEWQVLLTPLRSGLEPLLFEMPMMVAYRGQVSEDPFRRMQEAFWGGGSPFSRQERTQVYSEDMEIEVLPVPEATMPEDYTGGIGTFSLASARLDGDEFRVGEPFLYTISIEGAGNFARMRGPFPQIDDDSWRVYDPSESFDPSDLLGFEGVKSFTYTMIPRSDELTETPDFQFSYFDPSEQRFHKVEIPGQSIEVMPLPPGQVLASPSERRRNPVEVRRGPDLLPPFSQLGTGVSEIRLLPRSVLFWGTQTFLFAGLAGLFFYRRDRYRMVVFPAYAKYQASRRAIKYHLGEADRASQKGDLRVFLHHCYRGLQSAFGPFLEAQAESLTPADFHQVIKERSLPESCRSMVNRYSSDAEKIQYGGSEGEATELFADLPQFQAFLWAMLKEYRSARRSQRSFRFLRTTTWLWPLFFIPTFPLSGQTMDKTAVFQQGLEYYQEEEYQKAVEIFGELLDEIQTTALHFNLGNAYYRLGDFPHAILHFEKARFLDPGNADTKVNLALAREAAEVKAPPVSYLSRLGQSFRVASWWWIFSVSLIAFLFSLFILPLFFVKSYWCQLARFASLILLLVSLLGIWYWMQQARLAVVVRADAPILLAPTATSPIDGRWLGGETVRMGETHEQYVHVRLPSENTAGWTLRLSLRPIVDR